MSSRVGLYLFQRNEKLYPSVAVCAATTDDGNRSSTVCACGSPKQGPCNLLRGVYGEIIEMLTDLVTRPAQCEPKEQKFCMVFYDIVPPWSVALGDPAVRVRRTTPLSRTVAARSWNQAKTVYWIGLPEALHTIRATRIQDLVAWQNFQTLWKLRPEGSKHFRCSHRLVMVTALTTIPQPVPLFL